MTRPQSCRVLIAGAGPAGLATALYLLRRRPALADSIVALERARHPRMKVCAGGLIPKTMLALRELGLSLDVPAITVRRGLATTEAGAVDYRSDETLCTIVRRNEFDARLARAAREAGLRIIEDCRLLRVEADAGGVRVHSERGDFEAELLIGADGSGSRVRDAVFGKSKDLVGRALMFDVPVAAEQAPEFVDSAYRFDFTCVRAGIRGYSWSFPCLIENRPHLNVGIYDQCPRQAVDSRAPKARLLDALAAAFPALPIRPGSSVGFKSFPIRWYAKNQPFAIDRVLLAGDAAGVDPLMGEGISCAFEHGKLAARAVDHFLSGQRDAFRAYDDALHHSAVARKLRRLGFAARRFYGPHHRTYFRLAALSITAQRIGMDWYNGSNHLDEAPVLSLLAKWVRAVLFGAPMG